MLEKIKNMPLVGWMILLMLIGFAIALFFADRADSTNWDNLPIISWIFILISGVIALVIIYFQIFHRFFTKK